MRPDSGYGWSVLRELPGVGAPELSGEGDDTVIADMPRDTILLCRAGSHAYGTSTDASDTDYRGVMYATSGMLIGLDTWDTQFERKGPDTVIYTLPKFVKLALGANPNILDVLFCAVEDVLKVKRDGVELRHMASLFLSQRVYQTFTGYAHGQLKRLHNPGGRHAAHWSLVEKYGYDTKNAMHLVRLYRMGYEALTEGVIRVKRPDADELLAIRNGAWTLAEVEKYADDMELRCRAALSDTDLPPEPDTKRIVEWLMDTQRKRMVSND